MSRRNRKRYYIDAGEGVTLATSLRSPPDARTVEAFKALARATGDGAHTVAAELAAVSDTEAQRP